MGPTQPGPPGGRASPLGPACLPCSTARSAPRSRPRPPVVPRGPRAPAPRQRRSRSAQQPPAPQHSISTAPAPASQASSGAVINRACACRVVACRACVCVVGARLCLCVCLCVCMSVCACVCARAPWPHLDGPQLRRVLRHERVQRSLARPAARNKRVRRDVARAGARNVALEGAPLRRQPPDNVTQQYRYTHKKVVGAGQTYNSSKMLRICSSWATHKRAAQGQLNAPSRVPVLRQTSLTQPHDERRKTLCAPQRAHHPQRPWVPQLRSSHGSHVSRTRKFFERAAICVAQVRFVFPLPRPSTFLRCRRLCPKWRQQHRRLLLMQKMQLLAAMRVCAAALRVVVGRASLRTSRRLTLMM
jgi:hypothetical protein